jgi:hypothetical protein
MKFSQREESAAMDEANCELACGMVSAAYIRQGAQALASRRRLVKALLSSRRLPQRGWDEATTEMLLQVGAQELGQASIRACLSPCFTGCGPVSSC